MAVTIAWYVPEKVVYIAVNDAISLDDSSRISHKLTQFISASQNKVNILINLNNMDSSISTVHLLSSIITPLFFLPQLKSIISYTADNSVRKTLTSTMTSMFRARLRAYSSEGEALERLKKADESLTDLKPVDEVLASSG